MIQHASSDAKNAPLFYVQTPRRTQVPSTCRISIFHVSLTHGIRSDGDQAKAAEF